MHRLHPRTKALVFVSIVGALLAVKTSPGLMILAAAGCAAAVESAPRKKDLTRLARVLVTLAFVGLLLNALFTPGRTLSGPSWAPLWPTVEGLHRGALAALRLVGMASLAFALSTTTCPRALGEAVEGSLGRIPSFRGAGLAVDVAARFAPAFIDDARRVRAIRSIRVNPKGIGPLGRLRETGTYILPLMISAVRRAERLADAMAARCYVVGRGRAGARTPRPQAADYAALALTGALCALALLIRGA